jgi:hypothetical protein
VSSEPGAGQIGFKGDFQTKQSSPSLVVRGRRGASATAALTCKFRCSLNARHYENFQRGSDRQSDRIDPDRIIIGPIDDTTEALDRFQLVARTAIEQEGEGYEIVMRVFHGRIATKLTLRPLPE